MERKTDWTAFVELVKSAALLTGKQNITDGALKIFFDVLEEYDIEHVRDAFGKHFRSPEGRYFPTPSHIISQIEGTPEDRAAAAWALLERAILRYDSYTSVRFPRPAFHYAIRELGGWLKLCERYNDSSDREIAFMARDFKQFYAIGEKHCSAWNTVPSYFPGLFERDNEIGGYVEHIPPVVDVETGKRIKQSELRQLSSGDGVRKQLVEMTGFVAGAKKLSAS